MKRSNKPGWRTVSISAASRRLLQRRFAQYELTGGVRRADGRYDVQLDDEVLACLEGFDPDIDKAIEYACQMKH